MKAKLPYPVLPLFTLLALTNVAQASDINQGRDTYQRHCATCHGANGRPNMVGAADFKRGQGLMQSDHALLKRIQGGKNACPAYRGILSEQQTFDVIAYIRTMF